MPIALTLSFILLTALLYSFLVLGVSIANNCLGEGSQIPVYLMRFVYGGFLLVTGLLALQNTFADFSAQPPPVLVGIAIGFVLVVSFAFLPVTGQWLRFIPLWWLIAIQAFRVIVEVQLWFLAKTPHLPTLMTFEGRNFDVITGLSAIAVAFAVRKAEREGRPETTRRLVLGWNFLGLALLTNVVVHGLLSAPTAMQVFFPEPANRAIGLFPFAWLPMFVVPFAYLLHLLSLRKLLQRPRATRAESAA